MSSFSTSVGSYNSRCGVPWARVHLIAIRIRVGESATIKLIGDPRVLSGHVESIAYGIEDQNRSTSSELLASVNTTFSWIRLA